jgi:hypothetical protein
MPKSIGVPMGKIIFVFFLTIVSMAASSTAFATDCADISGKYESISKISGNRFLTIQQKSCDLFVVKLDNGSPGKAETIWANNIPYTYYAHEKSGSGQEVPNGQPIESSLKDRYKKASFSGTSLRTMEVDGLLVSTDICKQEITYQKDCSVTEIIYELKDQNTLIETQNGFTYHSGNMIPDFIEYKRVK